MGLRPVVGANGEPVVGAKAEPKGIRPRPGDLRMVTVLGNLEDPLRGAGKSFASAMSYDPADGVAFGPGQNISVLLALRGLLGEYLRRVTSAATVHPRDIDDMVSQLQRTVPRRRLKALIVQGHGNAHSQLVGGTLLSGRALEVQAVRRCLGGITSLFAHGAFAFLGGCRTGQAVELLTGLAGIWGVDVYAKAGRRILLAGFELWHFGDLVRATPDGKYHTKNVRLPS